MSDDLHEEPAQHSDRDGEVEKPSVAGRQLDGIFVLFLAAFFPSMIWLVTGS